MSERKIEQPDLQTVVAARLKKSTSIPEAFFGARADQIAQACWAMARRFHQRGRLLAFGTGACATDAQDLVTDLLNPPCADWSPLPAIALINDVAVVTAIGNDVGFDNVFALQVIAYGRPGDIALGLSTSGSSANILAAFEQAKKQGMLTIGLAGYEGGKMQCSRAVDVCITAPSDHIPRIQEAHATIYHTFIEIIHAMYKGSDRRIQAGLSAS